MKEKVVLVRPNGEMEEREIICYFKAVSDAHPNIKNVPVLVVDKKEQNNGNNVCEFFWEKDGLYTFITDEVAWKNVKEVIVDIIKANYEGKIEVSKPGNLQTSMEDGRSLALSADQMNRLVANYTEALTKVVNMPEAQPEMNEIASVANEVSMGNDVTSAPVNKMEEAEVPGALETALNNIEKSFSVEPVMPVNEDNNVNINPVLPSVSQDAAVEAPSVIDITPVIEPSPQVDLASPSVVETPVTTVNDIFEVSSVNEVAVPTEINPVVEKVPVTLEEGNIEIVSVSSEPSEFEKMMVAIENINKEYDEKIIVLNNERKSKIAMVLEEQKKNMEVIEAEIKSLREKASEHLKNAQAAEQIATLAQQNAQRIEEQQQ